MMTRRFVALFTAIFLCLGIFSGALAMSTVAISYSSTSDTDGEPLHCASLHQGAVYLLLQDGTIQRMDPATRQRESIGQCLFAGYHTEAEDVQRLRDDAEDNALPPLSFLFSGGEKLYGLCVGTGEWFTLLDETGAYAPKAMEYKLDTKSFIYQEDEYSMMLQSPSLFVQDGYLYYSGQMYTGMNGPSSVIGRIDMLTGEDTPFKTQFIFDLQPWKDGKQLCRLYDQANAYDMEANRYKDPEYGLFDPEADAFTPLGSLSVEGIMGGYSIAGLVGDAEKNSLYYFAGSRIMGCDLATGETRVSAYTGEGMFGGLSGNQTLLSGSYYIQIGYNTLEVYALDTDAVKDGALKVFGEFGGEAHKSFRTNYPDIPVEVADTYTSDLETLTTSMVSESDAFDVLLLNMSYMPVDRLVEKGYAMDISAYPELMEVASQMDPRFVDPMRIDGKLYGVPVGMSAYTFGVNMKMWTEELGLTEEELPKTVMELLEFFANWEDDYADDYPDMLVCGRMSERMYLANMIIEQYMNYQQSQGQPLSFDTPLLRKLLTAVEALDMEALSGGLDQDSSDYWNKPCLFDPYMTAGQFEYMRYSGEDTEYLLLPLDEGCDMVLGATVSVMIINPKSKRVDQAVLYVTNYLKNLPKAGDNITLFPAHNDPVEDASYKRSLEEYQKEKDKREALLEKADESEKASLRESVESMETWRENIEKWRYSASAEQIQEYREKIDPFLWVTRQSVFAGASAEGLSQLVMQYFEGAVPLDQFVTEMDKRLRLIQLEDQ